MARSVYLRDLRRFGEQSSGDAGETPEARLVDGGEDADPAQGEYPNGRQADGSPAVRGRADCIRDDQNVAKLLPH
jgi:hypothetical protein